jgi:uncharacterized SAM-binding protein YcdF (DUF218 family)
MKTVRTVLVRSLIGGALLVVVGTTVFSMPLISDVLIHQLQIYPALTTDDIASLRDGERAAIVILSAGRRGYAPEFGGETLDEFSLERVRYGADLARRTGLPILVSGGLGFGSHPALATLMTETLLRDYGIEATWQEDRSRTTAENAIYSAEILENAGIHRAVLVTHAWHMVRARASFLAQQMSVIPAPTAFYGRRGGITWREFIPDASALRMSSFAIHEIVGRQWYALRYGF